MKVAPKWTEGYIQSILFDRLPRNYLKAFRTTIFSWESDFVTMLPSGRMAEYEIKISVGDFRADKKKGRKRYNHSTEQSVFIPRYDHLQDPYNQDYIWPLSGGGFVDIKPNNFYYALPAEIYEKVKEEIPDFAGVIVLNHTQDRNGDLEPYIKKVKSAKILHKRNFKGCEQTLTTLYKSMMYKARASLNPKESTSGQET